MAKNSAQNNVDNLLKLRLNLEKRISIYERLMSYTKEGFPLFESLLKFQQRYEKKKDFRAKIIGYWLENMKHGLSFSQAIEGWIPDAELNLITSGEEGGAIEQGLEEAIKFSRAAQKIKSTIIAGSTYPLVLLLVVLGFVAMFSLKMAPVYLGILPLESWPDLGRNFYLISKFIVDYWYIILIFLIASSITITKTIGSWTGPLRDFADKLPPWSVYKVYQSSAFLISLSSMMKSATPLNDSLKKIKSTSSYWLVTYIDEMMKNLRRGGKNFGQHLNVGLLDEEIAGDVIDYSELGKFEEAIYIIGEKSLDESVKKIATRMALVKNIMIMFVGITVGVIYYTSIELNTTVAEAATTSTQTAAKAQ